MFDSECSADLEKLKTLMKCQKDSYFICARPGFKDSTQSCWQLKRNCLIFAKCLQENSWQEMGGK